MSDAGDGGTGEPEMLAPRGTLPSCSTAYRTIGPFDAATLPAGLKAEHRLKPGTWAVLDLTEGSLTFRWDDAAGGQDDLSAPARIAIPPEVPHHLELAGPLLLTVTFHSADEA